MGPIETEFFKRYGRRIDRNGMNICNGGDKRCTDCRCNLPSDWKKKDSKAAMKTQEKEFKLITAEEAREEVEGDSAEILKRIDTMIRTAVALGEHNIRVPYDLVRINGYSAAFKNGNVHNALTKAGYVIKARSAVLSFVDVWLEVSW